MTQAEWLAAESPAAMLEFLRGKASDRKLRLFAVALCRAVENGTECPHCKGTRKDPGDLARYKPCPACNGSGRVGGLADPRSRRAVEVAERFADGMATASELRDANRDATACAYSGRTPDEFYTLGAAWVADDWLISDGLKLLTNYFPHRAKACDLLRDIFGNPFRPHYIRSSWLREQVKAGKLRREKAEKNLPGLFPLAGLFPLVGMPYRLFDDDRWLAHGDGAVPKLARTIYDGRQFDLLPLLADELEGAGCEDAAILQHLRGEEPCPTCLAGPGRKKCPDCFEGSRPLRGPHVRGCWVIDMLLGKE